MRKASGHRDVAADRATDRLTAKRTPELPSRLAAEVVELIATALRDGKKFQLNQRLEEFGLTLGEC